MQPLNLNVESPDVLSSHAQFLRVAGWENERGSRPHVGYKEFVGGWSVQDIDCSQKQKQI